MKTLQPPLFLLVLLTLCVPFVGHAASPAAITIEVNAATSLGHLDPFWKATGFMPASLLEKAVLRESLRRIAATQPRAIHYLRPHYLLDLVSWENDRPQWDRFDAVMDFMVKELGFKLIFEVMGNPSKRFDFTKPADIARWREFVRELALHLQSRYGAQTLRSWWFECWNEPDIEDFWKIGDEAFLAYYDATWDGIKAADATLRFGGPANARGFTDFFIKWAAHVDAKGNADFISVHRKFLPHEMLAEERKLISHLKQRHPLLAKRPFLNTEADAEFGWSRQWWWRAHPWYPAFVAQSIDLHLKELIDLDGVNYAFGINDNGFPGDFGQRSLYASLAAPDGSVALIKKPVMAGMEMLARLGDTRLAFRSDAPGDGVGAIATRSASGEVAVLVYHRPDIGPPMSAGYPEIPACSAPSYPVRLRISGSQLKGATVAEWTLDEGHGNPYALWLAQGAPKNPSAAQLDALRAAEGPFRQADTRMISSPDGTLSLATTMPPSSLRLFIFSPAEDSPASNNKH